MAKERLFLGLSLGREVDGVECAVVAVAGRGDRMKVRQVGWHRAALLEGLADRLLNAAADFAGIRPAAAASLAGLDRDVSNAMADAARSALVSLRIDSSALVAAGMLGHVLVHSHTAEAPACSTAELGSPAAVAAAIGHPTVGDFARSAFGPDGVTAGLTWPDWLLLRDTRLSRVRLHLGAVATVTFVPADAVATDVVPLDAGPGVLTLDLLAHRLLGHTDPDGAVAAKGAPLAALLHELLADGHFRGRPIPLASPALWGPLFVDRLELVARHHRCSKPADLLATAAEFIARAIASAVAGLTERPHEVVLSGPGATNIHLASRIRTLLSPCSTYASDRYGIASQARTAVNCAVLAAARVDEFPVPIPEPMGQWRQSVFGGLFLP